MKPTPLELRKRIVAARYFDGQSMGQIAERFKIPKATVQNILRRYDLANTVEPKPQNAGRKPAITGACLKKLEQQVAKHPDATLVSVLSKSAPGYKPKVIPNALCGICLK